MKNPPVYTLAPRCNTNTDRTEYRKHNGIGDIHQFPLNTYKGKMIISK